MAITLAAAACGGSTPTGVTPPPPPASTPASIAVQSGDGQQAEPGVAVATKPAVVVKDSAGQPVAGVTVTFTVDSGGGSLSVTSALTGANGIATAGTWTLGAAEGRNTLKVTVGSLTPVKIAATAVIAGASFPTATIGTGGGSITVTQPGPLNGFSITVPGGAFTSSLVATVSYASNTSLPHSSVIIPVSPLITISTTTTAYATTPLTIHMPATIPTGDFPVIVIYDPSSGAREILTTVAWDANGVTAVTNTLSGAAILGASSLRANARGASLASPGAIGYVGALPPAVLMADYDSGYRPGVDDWEFPTTQTELALSTNVGNTVGLAATSLWYYSNAGVSRAKLNGRFMLQAGVPLSDRMGMRWAAVIGATYDVAASKAIAGEVGSRSGATTLAAFHQEQFLTIRGKLAASAENGGVPKAQLVEGITANGTPFYFIVYRASGTRLYIADPGFPGDATRFLEFPTDAEMLPYTTAIYSTSYQVLTPTALGLSSLFALDQFPVTYAQVLDGTIGQGQFPTYELHGWAGRLYDTLFLVDTLRWWVECANCTYGHATSLSPGPSAKVAGADLFTISPVRDLGAFAGNGYLASSQPSAGNDYPLGMVIGSAPFAQDATNRFLWLDWHQYVLRRLQTAILPSPLSGMSGIPLSMTFQVAQNLLPQHVNYVWDFGDQQPVVTVTVADNPAVQHTYAAVGTYQVTAKIVDTRNNQVIGLATATATIAVPQFAWQFTSVTQTGFQLPPGGIDPNDPTDQQVLGFFISWSNNLETTPRNSEFFLASDGVCQDIFMEIWPAGQFQPVIDQTGHATIPAIFGLTPACDPAHDWVESLAMGPLGHGTLIASAVDIPKSESMSLPGGSINATMNGTTLSGTFTWRFRYTAGEAVYSFSFTATQVLPTP